MSSLDSPFHLDPRLCEQARLTRDARFDGLFYTAVTSTGIYCRPVCPAPTPKVSNVKYFPTAAAAAAAGFRPCLRCRPEAAPGSPLHRVGNELVTSALRLIERGYLDITSAADLADRIGVGERHLRRLFETHLGASPLDIAATRRLLFAKQLVSESNLPMTDVALTAGYASLRRFNSTFRNAYGVAPRELRRSRVRPVKANELSLRLPYRPPYDFNALLEFFARRAIPGIEVIDAMTYRRTFVLADTPGWLSVTQLPGETALLLRVQHSHPSILLEVATRVRRMFDLNADALAIHAQLKCSSLLKPLLKRFPGIRVPGAWDGFEVAVRAVLGQQISVAAARTYATRLVQRYGTALASSSEELGRLFPTPEALACAELTGIGLPRARAATIQTLAKAFTEKHIHCNPEQTLAQFVTHWTTLPGIGAWTAHYIAMRALSHPDAFPAADLILRRAAGNGIPLTTAALECLSETWRPWRAYAVMLLWRSQS